MVFFKDYSNILWFFSKRGEENWIARPLEVTALETISMSFLNLLIANSSASPLFSTAIIKISLSYFIFSLAN